MAGYVLILSCGDELLVVLGKLLAQDGETRSFDELVPGLAMAVGSPPDLILLNGDAGLETCRQLRLNPLTTRVPLFMVGTPNQANSVRLALRPGTDTYINRPRQALDLVGPVRNALRRAIAQVDWDDRIVRGPLRIDPSRHELRVRGRLVDVTPTEFRLLEALASHPGRVFARVQLLRWVLGPGTQSSQRTIDTHIRVLRRKLGDCRDLIETVRGVGYRLRDEPGQSSPTGPLDGDSLEAQSNDASSGPVQHCLQGGALPAGVFLLERRHTYSVGRANSNEIVLSHNLVSRKHATVSWRSDGFTITDFSSNGTFVNNSRVEGSLSLGNDDRVSIGPFSLRFREFTDVQALLKQLADGDDDTTHVRVSLPMNALPAAFRGRMLIQYCQLICLRRHDCVLEIEGPLLSGQIEFIAGVIIGAQSGELRGEDAVQGLLAQTSGIYRVRSRVSAAASVDSSSTDTDSLQRIGGLGSLDRTSRVLISLEQTTAAAD